MGTQMQHGSDSETKDTDNTEAGSGMLECRQHVYAYTVYAYTVTHAAHARAARQNLTMEARTSERCECQSVAGLCPPTCTQESK